MNVQTVPIFDIYAQSGTYVSATYVRTGVHTSSYLFTVPPPRKSQHQVWTLFDQSKGKPYIHTNSVRAHPSPLYYRLPLCAACNTSPNSAPSSSRHRDLNALLQRLSADLEEAREAAEMGAKRADASALEVGARQEESRRLGEALARTESRVAATER